MMKTVKVGNRSFSMKSDKTFSPSKDYKKDFTSNSSNEKICLVYDEESDNFIAKNESAAKELADKELGNFIVKTFETRDQLNDYISKGDYRKVGRNRWVGGESGNKIFSMKSIKTFSPSKDDNKSIEEKIFDYIRSCYSIVSDLSGIAPVTKSKLKIDLTTNPPTVDFNGSLVFHKDEPTLTNGIFQWGKVRGNFECAYIGTLKSLEGAPNKVSGNFDCSHCGKLKSLEGAPKEVGGDFNCGYCESLTSLKGTPRKIGRHFGCICCPSLKSLKDAPKEVIGDFNCVNCGSKFTEDNVKQVCKVKGKVYC